MLNASKQAFGLKKRRTVDALTTANKWGKIDQRLGPEHGPKAKD